MVAYSINLPPDVQGQINSACAQYSVDAFVASAVAQVSSGGQQFFADGGLVVTPFGVGIMGISKATATSLGFDATTQEGNIQAGVVHLSALLQNTVGNYALALAAYVTSTDTVEQFNGIPPLAPVTNFVYNVSLIAANAGSTAVSSLLTLRTESSLDPSHAASKTAKYTAPPNSSGLVTDPQAHGQDNIDSESSIEPVLYVNDPTLSNEAWFADTGLVTGNPRIRASVQPVSFMVYLDRNDPNQFIKNPADNTPIELQLNTSLTTFEIASKHVYNRTPSRTGMHITLWGMEPDLISGTGTTGVFMNQFGLTDFMSTAGINDDIVKLVTGAFVSGFDRTFNTTTTSVAVPATTVIGSDANVQVVTDPITSVGQVTQTAITADQQTLNTVAGQRIAGGGTVSSQQFPLRGQHGFNKPDEAFRVAAQDAFVEFLKLFQMNGNIWFYSQDYANAKDGTTTNLGLLGKTQQESPTAWSKKTGTTGFQQHARNNDVMSRGYVAMRYRNNVYLGYFKNLSWTLDAESPFQWKFNFSFQVEKTYTALYFPQVSVHQVQVAG
jgi:hypothetical protein